MPHQREIRPQPPEPPRGADRLNWYGPRFLWMIPALASGELLFTPCVGARYRYEFLWIALIVFFFMWVLIQEVGRNTVAIGKTILDGYSDSPGPGIG